MAAILLPLLVTLSILIQPFVETAALAADLTPMEVAQKIQATYAKTKSLRADFNQTTNSRMNGRERHGSGTMVLVKPGLMRWDYQEPDQQVLVCDGQKISMYFSKEKQMMVTPAKEYLENDVTYAFFTGKGDLQRDFIVAGPEEEDIVEANQPYELKLTPKQNHPQIDFINLWVDRSTFLLKRLKVTDKFGTVTDIVFSNVVTNQEIPSSLFHFTPPKGTEIIDK
jgi:outer membrane lipoprotein carrier protein